MKKFDKRETIFHLYYLSLVPCTKDQLLGFAFNNCSSFVNSSLYLILCGDRVYVCKIKESKLTCHAVAGKLLAKWSPRELWQSKTEKLGVEISCRKTI